MLIVVALLLLPLLFWSWRRGNGEDAELALGAVAWLSLAAAGVVTVFVLWG